MPEWSLAVWTIILSTGVGVLTITVSGIAVWKSHAANEIAKQALKVQERGVDVAVSSEQRGRSANLHVQPPALHAKRETARFYMHNYGSSDAYDFELSLHHGDELVSFGKQARIAAGGMWPFEQSAGQVISRLENSCELQFELRATYRDGTGPRTTRWRVTIPPGERLVDREWAISDWPDEA